MTTEPAATAHESMFAEHRSLLFTVAYEILGSAADAEDVVQETWLRWAEVNLDGVRQPRAYLVRIATRQALNRLRTLTRRRESYVGPWLPEPLVTVPDVADDVVLADSVSTAMLLVLETLRPEERVVFVLREVFDVGYDEVAEALDKSPAAVRQLAHRARSHVAARRPRMPVADRERERVTQRFLTALASGDLQSLVDVLAPDVVLRTDGGGLVKAALRPIVGVEKVLRFATAIVGDELEPALLSVNGGVGIAFTRDGRLDALLTWEVTEGEVTEVFVQRNPEKLALVGSPQQLARWPTRIDTGPLP